jgi:uridine kinase
MENILHDIRNLSDGNKVVLVAIDGVGGSGKTTLAKILQHKLSNCRIVQLDDFYSPLLQSADLLRLKDQVVAPLKKQKEARYQIYDWKSDRLSGWHT